MISFIGFFLSQYAEKKTWKNKVKRDVKRKGKNGSVTLSPNRLGYIQTDASSQYPKMFNNGKKSADLFCFDYHWIEFGHFYKSVDSMYS